MDNLLAVLLGCPGSNLYAQGSGKRMSLSPDYNEIALTWLELNVHVYNSCRHYLVHIQWSKVLLSI